MSKIQSAQDAVRNSASVDAWLLYDFRGNNEYLWQIIGKRRVLTRRCFLFIPRQGTPTAVVHFIDKPQFPTADEMAVIYYSTWPEFHDLLRRHLTGLGSVAMEYSPMGELPTASMVDGGVVDLVRSMNVTPVSSAALFQETLAVWTPDGFASHQRAVDRVYDALRIALGQVRDSIESDLPVNEYQIQQVIMQNFAKWGLESEDEAIVAVNANSGDPHYEPSKDLWSPIRRDDWLLIDLWAREPGEENIFADVTWVACVGSEPRAEHQRAFAAVTEARDAVVDALDVAWRSGDFGYEGWQLDDVARDVLVRHGYSESVKHRTGHSIGPGRFLHALGVNLDNFETHDTRPVRPGVGFSVEPGVYLPGFGMRSEINVYVDPVSGPLVTTPAQRSIDLLFA